MTKRVRPLFIRLSRELRAALDARLARLRESEPDLTLTDLVIRAVVRELERGR